jgi:hypothetical protein
LYVCRTVKRIALTESCPKTATFRGPRFLSFGSLVPSAGTIFNLEIDVSSYHRCQPRRHSVLAFQRGSVMQLARRNFLRLAADAAVLPAMPRVAIAQANPTRPVRFIVGYARGGANDIVARLIGQMTFGAYAQLNHRWRST